jgi:Sulfite exporter TauE/SafE
MPFKGVFWLNHSMTFLLVSPPQLAACDNRMSVHEWMFVGLCAGALSGIIATGSTIILLPILVYQFGPKQAVPVMAIAALMSNIEKVMAWWRHVDWRAFAAYSITGCSGCRPRCSYPVDIAVAIGRLSYWGCSSW